MEKVSYLTTWAISVLVLIASSAQGISNLRIREDLLNLIKNNPSGHLNAIIRKEFSNKLQEFAETDVDQSDIIFAIGASVFGVDIIPPKKVHDDEEEEEGPVIVDFDYMQQFMKDVFLSYGCTEQQAEISSDVLIESDKRT